MDSFRDLVREADALNVDPYDLITKIAEKIPPGADGLIALPFLTGERSPFWNDKARGAAISLI